MGDTEQLLDLSVAGPFEREDASVAVALGLWSVSRALRAPEPDEMPGQPWEPHPDSFRAAVLALHATVERTVFLLRNLMRRRPQGPRPKHYPRRRRGRP